MSAAKPGGPNDQFVKYHTRQDALVRISIQHREWVRRILTFLVPFLIAGLDMSFAQKALFIVIWMWAALVFWHLFQVSVETRDSLHDIIMFSRLTYIAVHLRNEKEGRPHAKDRLEDDLKCESARHNWIIAAQSENLGFLLNVTYLVVFGVHVAAALALARALANPDSVKGAMAWLEQFLGSVASIGSE